MNPEFRAQGVDAGRADGRSAAARIRSALAG